MAEPIDPKLCTTCGQPLDSPSIRHVKGSTSGCEFIFRSPPDVPCCAYYPQCEHVFGAGMPSVRC